MRGRSRGGWRARGRDEEQAIALELLNKAGMATLSDNPIKFNYEPVTSQAYSNNENGGCMQGKEIKVEM